MIVKGLGVLLVLLGLAMSIFARMAYLEFRAAATSETQIAPDSLPLTKIVGPELFDPGYAGTRPSELARKIVYRMYIIAGAGILAAILGVLILALPKSRRQNNSAS